MILMIHFDICYSKSCGYQQGTWNDIILSELVISRQKILK